jgi:catechol 2,3-dioxygenase
LTLTEKIRNIYSISFLPYFSKKIKVIKEWGDSIMGNFDILRTARIVLHVTDLEKSKAFYDTLGFVLTEEDENALYYRGYEEHNHHSLVLKQSDKAAVEAIGFKVRSEQDLDELEALFRKQGAKVKWLDKGAQKAVGRALRVQDISGLPIEFYAEMDVVERLLQRYNLYRGSKVQRIDHFNCAVSDVQKAYDFYTKTLGFACSEYTVDELERNWACWLHRKPNVHDIAFMNNYGPRLHHIGFWLPDPLALIDTCDILAASGYASHIERGPGRHGLSNAFFLYLRDPDGHRIELYFGDYLTSDPDFEPIKWNLDDPMRQTFWGHAAPDSWFEETSAVLDIETGEIVDVKEPKLERKKPQFII